MDIENMDCVVAVEVSGLVLQIIYEDVCKSLEIEPKKDRVHWFDFYEEYELFQEFIYHLMICKIDFWVQFDGKEIYDYGKEGVNKNTES